MRLGKPVIMGVGIVLMFSLATACSSNGDAPRPDVANVRYEVDGETFQMKAGRATIRYQPDSEIANELRLEGNPVFGDFDGDGRLDAVIQLVNNPGGSGTFFYIAMWASSKGKSQIVKGHFLGDRIKGLTLEKSGTVIEIGFRDYRSNQSFAEEPSFARRLIMSFDPVRGEAVLVEPRMATPVASYPRPSM